MAEKILIVDDDLDTLKLVGLMLQRQGYEIVAANNGEQALSKASQEKPDLILLDVMMPDMDGYEVTRKLRADAATQRVPIIMFTAKTLVDDKVAGFEAGVDDYMTKPTHPAELASRVKALLARSAAQRSAAPDRGRIIGVLGAKGGLGVSTLALNVGVALSMAGEEVALCDLRPGAGTLGLQLGLTRTNGFGALLGKTPVEITPRAIESQIVTHGSGMRLLLSSHDPAEVRLGGAMAQAEAIVRGLTGLSHYLVLDLGSTLTDMVRKVVVECDALILIVEPISITLTMGKSLLEGLEAAGLGQAEVEVVIVNRTRSSLQLPLQTCEAQLRHSISSVITPAPELAYQAAESNSPMVSLQPDSLTADLYRQLAERVHSRVSGRTGAPT